MSEISVTPAETGGLVERLRSWDHCWPAPWLENAVSEAATALEAQAAELAAARQQYVDANEARIDAEAALAEARNALEQAEQQLDYGQVDAAHRIIIRAVRRALTGGE